MEWVVIAGLAAICFILHKFTVYFLREKEIEVSEFKRYIIGWTVTILVFGSYWYYVSSTSIKDGGIYYVYLFEKQDSQKNYKVPGLIYKDDHGPHLFEVYWSNKGSSSFEYGMNYVDLQIGKKVLGEDDGGKEWYIELTNEKASIKK